MLEVNVFPCIFSFDYMYKDNSFFFWVLPHFRLKSPAEDRGRGTVSAYQVCSGVMITWDVCRVMLGGGGLKPTERGDTLRAGLSYIITMD